MKFSQKGLGLFLFLGLIWGSAFVGIEVVVHLWPAWFSAALRLGIASLALYLIVLFRKSSLKIPKSKILPVWGAGLLAVGFPFFCLFWSEQRVSAGLAGILNGTVPIWTAMAILIYQTQKLKQRMDYKILGGVLLGFLGLWIIFSPRITTASTNDELAGSLGLLIMALSYATSNVANRKILTDSPHLRLESLIFHQHFISFIFVLVMSCLFETWPTQEQIFAAKPFLTTVYLGVISSAVAYLIYFHLLKTIGAVQTASVTYLIPLVALVLDFLVQGHVPELSSIFGVLFILIALAFIRSTKPI